MGHVDLHADGCASLSYHSMLCPVWASSIKRKTLFAAPEWQKQKIEVKDAFSLLKIAGNKER